MRGLGVRQEEEEGGGDVDAIELEEHVSEQLICPISHRIMDFPVISPTGHTYDQASIAAWLRRRAVDPLSLTPLAPSSLYPNRAVQAEIVAQLQSVEAEAASSGDTRLAAAAQSRLKGLQDARAEAMDSEDDCKLDRLTSMCARWVAVWGLIAWEQVLVFTSSFGCLLCLVYDGMMALGFRHRAAITSGDVARPVPLLAKFMRLTLSPAFPVPSHWGRLSKLTVVSLRCALVLPLCPMFGAFALGALTSFARFVQRCSEARAVEHERAAQSQWFIRTLYMFNSIAGLSSFGLFLRLYWDRRKLP